MGYAGLAMLGLAVAAIVMVLLTPQRGDVAGRHEDGPVTDAQRDSPPGPGPADAAAQPGS